MSQARAAIVSKNKLISRLVEAELSILGFEVELFDSCEGRLDGYFAVICDCTGEAFSPHSDARIRLAIVNEQAEESDRFTHTLPFPFHLQKLRSIMRVSPSDESTPDDAEKRILILDADALTVRLFDRSVKLSKNEFKVIEALCKSHGQCVTRKALTELLGATDGNIADVYICHLRKKLEEPFGVKIIYSLRSEGYMTKFIMK